MSSPPRGEFHDGEKESDVFGPQLGDIPMDTGDYQVARGIFGDGHYDVDRICNIEKKSTKAYRWNGMFIAACDPDTIRALVEMAKRGMELVSFSDAMHKASEDHRKTVNHFMNSNPDDQ